MKIYLTVDITKGWDTWNEMAEELNSDMVSVGGMQFIYKGCEIERDLPEYIRSFADKMGITNISDPQFVLHVQHLFFHATKSL